MDETKTQKDHLEKGGRPVQCDHGTVILLRKHEKRTKEISKLTGYTPRRVQQILCEWKASPNGIAWNAMTLEVRREQLSQLGE